MGDALRLTQEMNVQWVFVGKGSLQHPSIQRLAQQLPRRTKIREVHVGEQIGKELSLQVLAPSFEGKGENEDSLVLKTTIKGQHFLFTGDLDQAGERSLLRQYPNLQADVLKVGHHGSRTSTDPDFIKQLSVKEAIISCGRKNQFKHPHPEVLDTLVHAGVTIYRTDVSGMIRYEWSRDKQMATRWLADED